MLNRTIDRLRRAGVVGAALLLAACAQPATHISSSPEPVQCTDPSYLELRRQNLDSLSDRSWQRLQALDRDCAAARAQVSRTGSAPASPARHSGGHMMGSGIVATIIMAAMVASMW